jgi:hypothetical protein
MSAQGPHTLTVQVPFGFHVGSSTLPSGEYMVDTDVAPGILRLRSGDSKSTVMIHSMSVQAPARSDQGKLIFNKYGDEYFLSQVWKQGASTGRELPKSRREIEVAALARRGSESILARK